MISHKAVRWHMGAIRRLEIRRFHLFVTIIIRRTAVLTIMIWFRRITTMRRN
jgi:hypothetical protein